MAKIARCDCGYAAVWSRRRTIMNVLTANPYENIDITSRIFKADPFPFYAYLRAEAPVFRVDLPYPLNRPVCIISRYEDVLAALKDERFAKDKRNVMSPKQLGNHSYPPPAFRALE